MDIISYLMNNPLYVFIVVVGVYGVYVGIKREWWRLVLPWNKNWKTKTTGSRKVHAAEPAQENTNPFGAELFSSEETMSQQQKQIASDISHLQSQGTALKEQHDELIVDHNKEVATLNSAFEQKQIYLKRAMEKAKEQYDAKLKQKEMIKDLLVLQREFDNIDGESKQETPVNPHTFPEEKQVDPFIVRR